MLIVLLRRDTQRETQRDSEIERKTERELMVTCTTEEDKDELSHQGIQVFQKKRIW
jgi:hypothetical protein